MVVVKEETRKGPWTEEEDMQLVCFVGLFGERRWDFIAKVSGLHRTGKSCRLRWVNYLHPGLKRGRMTPQEERLVLELHARWGNRWSRIARKLPGRTDNEIKNYWRTHMRKKAQERKRNASSSSLSSSSSSSSFCSTSVHNPPPPESQLHGTTTSSTTTVATIAFEEGLKGYPMEKIWDEIASSEMSGPSGLSYEEYKDETCNISCPPPPPPPPPTMRSPLWDYGSDDTLWKMDDEEEFKNLFQNMITMGET